MSDESWRTEADDDWAAERRSGFMNWLRHRLRPLTGIAGAVSHADTGPYAGAPRAPRLRAGDEQTYSTVRYATGHVTYTSVNTDHDECPACGQRMVESHGIEYIHGDETPIAVGAVRTCGNCQADSWLVRSRMPAAARARKVTRKYVV